VVAKQADTKKAEDMKSGGKSCKKCKQGKSGGGGGHDHGSGGHDHGAEGHGAEGAGDIDALRQHVRQLEKRLDLMQILLETLAGQGRQGARDSKAMRQSGDINLFPAVAGFVGAGFPANGRVPSRASPLQQAMLRITQRVRHPGSCHACSHAAFQRTTRNQPRFSGLIFSKMRII